MDLLATLGRTLGFSLAAGVNLYATVFILGLASRYHWVQLPDQFKAFDNPWIVGAAGVLYVVEFVADKVPWVDSIWDSVHTLIRPVGGAVIAVASLGDASPAMTGAIALLGGVVSASSHATKAGTRVAANTSPEPFSNWFLSLLEDGIAFFLVWLTATHPLIALVIVIALTAVAVYLVWRLWAFARRIFPRRAA